MAGSDPSPLAALRAVVARGQAAQRAVDQVLAEVLAEHTMASSARARAVIRDVADDSDFPPWKRCTAQDCKDDTGKPRWTRGLFCPIHTPRLDAAGEDRGRPAGRGNQPPTRSAAIQGVTGPAASGGNNAPKKQGRATRGRRRS